MKPDRLFSIAILVLIVVLFSACGGGGDNNRANNTPDEPEQPAITDDTPAADETPAAEEPEGGEAMLDEAGRGAEVFASYCMACHKMGDEGGSMASDLSDVGSRLTADDLKYLILNPPTGMPPQSLSEEDLNALIGYLINMD
ncbi:MAG TPA: cytochrome c [bacterium]|jgi:mono/diheme cytochrome c family protein